MDAPLVTEAVCSKCEMLGGREEACVSRAALLKIQQDPKRVCPRIELLPENEVPAEIAWFAVKLGGDHPLFGRLFDLHTSEMDAEGRVKLFYRILAAVSDPGIAARIKAARERALRSHE